MLGALMDSNFWQLIGVVMAVLSLFVGAIGWLVKALLNQLEKRLDERFAVQEQARALATANWEREFGALAQGQRNLERDLMDLKAELPKEFVRREDAIREQTVIHAKFDSLAAKIDLLADRIVRSLTNGAIHERP